MSPISISSAAAFIGVIYTVAISCANAQTPTADPHHGYATSPQVAPDSRPVPTTQPAVPGMISPGMMGQGMMGHGMAPQGRGRMMQPGMMCGMGQPGMGGMAPSSTPVIGMRGHMAKVIFAVADMDGDNSLSFEEVSTLHKRIFGKIDANKDGKVTPEEVEAFMRD